jgi:hypothetical protein
LPYEPTTPESVTDARAGNPTGRRFEYVRAALRDNCSVIDLARFTAIHLRGARGRGHFLRPETYLKLYEPQPPTNNAGFGFFRNQQKGIEGDILTHNGGNGTSCSVFMIAPDENVAA